MKHYEFSFASVNSQYHAKPITVLVIEPETVNQSTGMTLFTHGWGGNRFQHRDKMEYAAEHYNVIAISAEFRMSGFDFNPVTGQGWFRPYDTSFLQVFDVLGALRQCLKFYSGINRRRIYAYGGSQGGHITLLSAIFAPATFAGIYTSSAMVMVEESKQLEAGRCFAPWEMEVRDVLRHADAIRCPIFMEHGTADEDVDCDLNTRALEARLRQSEKPVEVRYYEGGSHALTPTISRLEAFIDLAPKLFACPPLGTDDDFLAENTVVLDCGTRELKIDWKLPSDSMQLFEWRNP